MAVVVAVAVSVAVGGARDLHRISCSVEQYSPVSRTNSPVSQNISLSRVAAVSVPNGTVGGYTHNNGSYGALVAASVPSSASTDSLQGLAKSLDQIAQHIVAIDPAEGDGAANPLKHLLTQVWFTNAPTSSHAPPDILSLSRALPSPLFLSPCSRTSSTRSRPLATS